MPGLTFEQALATKGRLLALTGLEKCEFEDLLPSFETALMEHLNQYTIEGEERVGRDFVDYKNGLLPTTKDKLLFVLVFLKLNLIQEAMGAMFDMSQPKVNDWLKTLISVLQKTLRSLGDSPSRSIEEMKFDLERKDSPLFVWTLRNVPFLDPSMKLSSAPITAARRNVT
jgi:Helix-turn-helix of DDE superfamily endonuclease